MGDGSDFPFYALSSRWRFREELIYSLRIDSKMLEAIDLSEKLFKKEKSFLINQDQVSMSDLYLDSRWRHAFSLLIIVALQATSFDFRWNYVDIRRSRIRIPRIGRPRSRFRSLTVFVIPRGSFPTRKRFLEKTQVRFCGLPIFGSSFPFTRRLVSWSWKSSRSVSSGRRAPGDIR